MLTSAIITNYLFSLIRMTTPLAYGSMGAVISKQAGTNNLAIEATMLLSSMVAVGVSVYMSSPWLALAVGCLVGVLVSLFLAMMFLKYKSDSAMTCISLNTVAMGLAMFIPLVWFGSKGAIQNRPTLRVPSWDIPLIKDIPFVGEVVSGHCVLTYLAVVVVFFVWFLLFKTPLGLRIRAAGENAEAATSVGINVYHTKLISFVFTGIVCGFAGAYMSMYYVSWFAYGLIAGRGFVCVSISNLTGGRPWGSYLVAFAFGAIDALAMNLQSIAAVPAELLQLLPYLATIIGVTLVGYFENQRLKKEQ